MKLLLPLAGLSCALALVAVTPAQARVTVEGGRNGAEVTVPVTVTNNTNDFILSYSGNYTGTSLEIPGFNGGPNATPFSNTGTPILAPHSTGDITLDFFTPSAFLSDGSPDPSFAVGTADFLLFEAPVSASVDGFGDDIKFSDAFRVASVPIDFGANVDDQAPVTSGTAAALTINPGAAPAPEPGTLASFATGLLGLGGLAVRMRRRGVRAASQDV